MDVVVWLRTLGLGRYEAAFRDNEIDETVLPNLTAEDLKDLGVSVVGHRRKLLDAIAALRTDADATPSSGAATRAPTVVSPEDRAERRLVTVMFSDLVGSTALSARMDPEDSARSLRPIRSASQRRWVALEASLRSTWEMVSLCTLGIRRHMRTTRSAPCAQGWSWLVL